MYTLLSLIAVLLVVLIAVLDGGRNDAVDRRVSETSDEQTESVPTPRDPDAGIPAGDLPAGDAPGEAAPAGIPGDGESDESVEAKPDAAAEPLFPAISSAKQLGTIYIVLDDAGYDLDQLRPFLEVPGSLSIAVLPQLAHSDEAAGMIAAAGKTVMLHLPMEPLGSADPGPGAILTSMETQEIVALVAQNLNSVPGAAGVNNHMGSRATGDARVMEAALGAVEAAGLFFIDSRTTADTTGAAVAGRLGIPFAERDVFLDNERDRESVLSALREVVELATRQEVVVAIGHVTTPVLAELLGSLHRELALHGYRLGALDQLLPTRLAME